MDDFSNFNASNVAWVLGSRWIFLLILISITIYHVIRVRYLYVSNQDNIEQESQSNDAKQHYMLNVKKLFWVSLLALMPPIMQYGIAASVYTSNQYSEWMNHTNCDHLIRIYVALHSVHKLGLFSFLLLIFNYIKHTFISYIYIYIYHTNSYIQTFIYCNSITNIY